MIRWLLRLWLRPAPPEPPMTEGERSWAIHRAMKARR